MKILRQSFYFLFATLFILASCVDDDFDNPPLDGEDPNITVNTTIAELLALHQEGNFEKVTDDMVVSGIVIADDRSGNFYKSLVIQDSTAGILVRLDVTDFFNEYGEGRRLFIKCKGLWLGDYVGLPQLGAGTAIDDRGRTELTALPSALFDSHILKGKWNQHRTPTIKTINSLRASDLNTLITIENVQFTLSTCERTFATDYVDVSGVRIQQTLNQEIESCTNGSTVVMRTSGFASFAREMLPTGSGSITAVYSIFGSTKQLTIRESNDAVMNDARCGNSGIGGTIKTIAEVRGMFTGGAQVINEDSKIVGTVISDVANGNTTNRNMIIQDGSGGIVVRFQDGHEFGLGEIVEVNMNGVELSEFNGLMQLNEVPISNAFTTCNIGEIIPRAATVQEIFANASAWESTLVKVKAATLSGGATFSGSITVTDASGSINMFTQSFANFASTFLPTGEVGVTAMIGDFNGTQLNIRNLSDIEGGDFGGDPTDETIDNIRALFTGTQTNVNNNVQITGVVISDINTGHYNGQNLVLQDGTGGIVIRFAEEHPYTLGTQLTISARGVELSEFNGLLQLNFVPLAAVLDETTGTLPSPRAATVAEIKANGEAWESTLVKINEVTITGASTFEGVTKVTDSTGSLDMFTTGAATFSGEALPSAAVNLTGIVSEYQGTRQVGIRSLADIE